MCVMLCACYTPINAVCQNKPIKERQVPYDFTYMQNLMNKITNKIETDSQIENRLTAMGQGKGGGAQELSEKEKNTHGHRQQYGD